MSEASRKAILDQAAGTPELVAEVPPVVAAGFGVLPLRRLGDRLTVACFPHANRRALRVLREVLGLEIVATPFDQRLLHAALRKAYFAERESVNLPTFREPDFLERSESASVLAAEKVERIPAGTDELDPEQVVLGELTYRSLLVNLDRTPQVGALPDPGRLRLVLGDLEPAWLWQRGSARRCAPASPAARLLLNEYRFTEYDRGLGATQVSEHAIRASVVEELPHVVHATEVQVVGIEADGSLRCHVYDEVLRVPVGAPTRLAVSYHFLSYGSRLERRIEVEFHGLHVQGRVDAPLAEGSAWSAHEFGRWLDLPRRGSMCNATTGLGRPDA